MARLDPVPPAEGRPDILAALAILPDPSRDSAKDPNDPASPGYAERTSLHLSNIGGLSIETLGHALP